MNFKLKLSPNEVQIEDTMFFLSKIFVHLHHEVSFRITCIQNLDWKSYENYIEIVVFNIYSCGTINKNSYLFHWIVLSFLILDNIDCKMNDIILKLHLIYNIGVFVQPWILKCLKFESWIGSHMLF